MRFLVVGVVVLASVLAVPATARADDPASSTAPTMVLPVAPPPVKTRTVSYAYMTLIADGVAAAVMIGAFVRLSNDPPEEYGIEHLAIVGAAGSYLLGAPIIHAIIDDKVVRSAGFFSIVMRLGLPIAGGVIANGMSDGDNAPAIGIVAGMTVAAVLDAAFLARASVVDTAPRVAPTLTAGSHGVSVGIGGRF